MELPSAGPCCSSWMVWHSAGGWACVKTAFLTTQARHVSCFLSTVCGTSLTGLEGFQCLYILYCIICQSGKSSISNHNLLNLLVLCSTASNKSVVASRPSQLPFILPSPHTPRYHDRIVACIKNYLAAIDRPDPSSTCRRATNLDVPTVRPAPPTSPCSVLVAALTARALGLSSVGEIPGNSCKGQ